MTRPATAPSPVSLDMAAYAPRPHRPRLAAAAVIAVLAGATAVSLSDGRRPAVDFPIPQPGDVYAALFYGTPMYVVGATDGAPPILLAAITPDGREIVGWCAADRTFVAGLSRDRWDEAGRHIDGPSVFDLATMHARVTDGAVIPVARYEPVATAERGMDPGPSACPSPWALEYPEVVGLVRPG